MCKVKYFQEQNKDYLFNIIIIRKRFLPAEAVCRIPGHLVSYSVLIIPGCLFIVHRHLVQIVRQSCREHNN